MKIKGFLSVKILLLTSIVTFLGVFQPKNAFSQHHSEEKTSEVLVDSNHAMLDSNSHVDSAQVGIEAHAEGAHEESEAFNAGEMILEHIADAYEWHIMDIGHTHVTIPLPLILVNDGKLDVFMSSGFHHGHDTVWTEKGYGYYLNEKHKLESTNKSSFIDLSITKNVAALFFSMIVILLIFMSVAKRYKTNANQAPKGLQSLLEPFIMLIRDDVAKPSIGKNSDKYVPYLLTVFFFIWINNLMGLIPIAPFGANLTGNIACTMTLALITFFITLFSAKKDYWIHIVNTPGVPWWLKFPIPLMPVIELLGVFIKPFVLTLRLFANITAGHIIPLGFFSLIFIFGQQNMFTGYGVSVGSIALSLFMSVLELLVAFLQAYIFTLLSAMYFGQAVEEHHHEEHH